MAMGLILLKLALPLLLLLSHSPSASGTTYEVGEGFVSSWTAPVDFTNYAFSNVFYSGDVLSFTYDYSRHNVWQFQDSNSYYTCDFSGGNLLSTDNARLVNLYIPPDSAYEYLYFGSSRGTDCAEGMHFSLALYPADDKLYFSPSPTGNRTSLDPFWTTLGAPSTISSWAAEAKKKNIVRVAARGMIAVAVLLVVALAIALCITIFCFCRARKNARMAAAAVQARGGGAGFPPQSPLPTLHPIQVPERAPQHAPLNGKAARPSPPPRQGGYVQQQQ